MITDSQIFLALMVALVAAILAIGYLKGYVRMFIHKIMEYYFRETNELTFLKCKK